MGGMPITWEPAELNRHCHNTKSFTNEVTIHTAGLHSNVPPDVPEPQATGDRKLRRLTTGRAVLRQEVI